MTKESGSLPSRSGLVMIKKRVPRREIGEGRFVTDLRPVQFHQLGGPCPCCGQANADESDPCCDACFWQRSYYDEMEPSKASLCNNGQSLDDARILVAKLGPLAGRLTLRAGGVTVESALKMTGKEIEAEARRVGLNADYS